MTAPSLPAQVIADIETRREAAHVIAWAEYIAEVDAIFADRTRALAEDGQR